jgi:hypothetical protein
VKSSLATVDCSDKSRSKQESLDEVTMALYITADEINVMERWGKAAKDRRKWEVKMMRVPEVDKIQMLAYVTDHKLVSLLATAANISFAERALQREHIRFLRKVNNEAKVRRSTKSIVLGKVKVMSYEDLVEARAKRAAKEQVTASKGRRGRKRKDQTQPEAALVVEYGAPVAQMI